MNQPPNSSKGNSSNSKAKEKGVYKGNNRLPPEELERYHKDNRCFKCGEQGHAYRACPQRNARNEQLRASIIEAPKEDVHCKGSPLSYAWGKVREHDAFILFDPGSTHNFISHELAAKLGIQEFEMGDAMKADGAFIGQDASVTPLIGKLRLHIQGYVDKEDFFISPLKHEDVILGAPWFDRLAASIKFLERRISFKFREKNMYIDAQESGLDQPLFWYDPKDKATWLNNAFSSITGLVKRYNLDGIDVDYDNFHYPNNFSSTMGELLARLRKEEEVKVVSIAPFNWMIPSCIELFQAFNESIDYVNYQFYADGVPNATKYLATYNKKAQTFGVDKMIPSYEISYEINGRGVQGQAWWDSLALIHAHNPIPGLMIWSADESAPLHYYYEIQAQELLANGTYS
ncbi:hypothetical protein L7F22_063607 [Adiantum nelumboides]|nr:hypothetical protein [Adiantum nelumboides]